MGYTHVLHTHADLRAHARSPTPSPVVHHQHLQVSHVLHHHLLEAGRQHMPGLGVRAVPDVGHEAVALELTAHGIIDTCAAGAASISELLGRRGEMREGKAQ